MLNECENCRECTVTGICAYTGENFAETEEIREIEEALELMSKRDQRKADSLGLCEEISQIVKNCECGNINQARLVDLSKLRKWEIMEIIGNYLDPRGEEVEGWADIKRLATFCKAFGIPEDKINEFYALGINEGGYEIAYITKNSNIILVLWEEETETTEAEPEGVGGYEPLEIALRVSQSKPSSLYNLSKGDREKGFFFTFEGLEVPFKVLLNENQKTEGIAGLCFGTAKDCPSQALGLCQLPDTSICYARAGESRATKRGNEQGLKGMDSYYNGVLCGHFWDRFATDWTLRVKFMDFLDSKGIETLRFNLKGDFRHETDIIAMYHLAESEFNCTCYTARDDLAKVLEVVANHPNIWVNGSNRPYTNRFKATTSLQEYLEADFPCLGSCSNCRKCYTLRGKEIICLVHGSGSDTLLNNEENQKFIIESFRSGNLAPVNWEDFKRAKGLTTCLNKGLEASGFALSFKNAKDILKFIRSGATI